MLLYWYTFISMNIYYYEIHHIPLETDWWALSNTSLIVRICSAIHEILADKAFTDTDGLISQLFVVAFVHPTYVQIALIWGFPAQLSLWKSVYWLWRYKLNEVCNTYLNLSVSTLNFSSLLSRASTSWLVIFSFNSLNVFWCSSSHFYSFFSLSSLRSFTI